MNVAAYMSFIAGEPRAIVDFDESELNKYKVTNEDYILSFDHLEDQDTFIVKLEESEDKE
ncbi:hypothetical protein LC087_16770 [Bacillus carboniphilus]|uniref:Uncharacterized protein n=1 Tax=Bacillus carboniphilus TaxID=86663 RepID=A0ABY9JSH1_9BACI|nr:hypothetical protein [Bacillus carboniphilus]WLR42341.1 hypothetical protein LC087_16770 [Bacillus carboniphilus]